MLYSWKLITLRQCFRKALQGKRNGKTQNWEEWLSWTEWTIPSPFLQLGTVLSVSQILWDLCGEVWKFKIVTLTKSICHSNIIVVNFSCVSEPDRAVGKARKQEHIGDTVQAFESFCVGLLAEEECGQGCQCQRKWRDLILVYLLIKIRNANGEKSAYLAYSGKHKYVGCCYR